MNSAIEWNCIKIEIHCEIKNKSQNLLNIRTHTRIDNNDCRVSFALFLFVLFIGFWKRETVT